MAKRFRFLGHPLHPALVHFPMGLLPMSFLWDLFSLWRKSPFWDSIAFWTLVAGLAALVPALVTGFLDFLAIPDEEEKALYGAYWHMGVMMGAASFFLAGLLVRMGNEIPVIPTPFLAILLSALGTLAVMAGGYLGGSLVYKHGVGGAKQK